MINQIALFLLTTSLTARLFVSGVRADAGTNVVINALTIASTLCFLLSKAASGGLTLRYSLLDLCLLLFATLSMASVFVAEYKLAAIVYGTSFLSLVLLFWIVANFIDSADLLRILLPSLVIVVMYGIYHQIFGDPKDPTVKSNFSVANIYSGFLAVTLLFSLALPLRWKLLLIPLAMASLVFGITFASISCMAAAIVFSPFAWRVGKKTAFICAISCMFVTALLFFLLSPTGKREVYETAVKANGFLQQQSGSELYPLGVGLNNFQDYYAQYQKEVLYETHKAHHDYLQIFAELGPLGLVVFLLIWILIIRQGFVRDFKEESNETTIRSPLVIFGAFLGFAIAYLLNDTFSDLLNGPLLLFIFLLCWILLYLRLPIIPITHTERSWITSALIAASIFMASNTVMYELNFAVLLFLLGALVVRHSPNKTIRIGQAPLVGLSIIFALLLVPICIFSIRLVMSYTMKHDPQQAASINTLDPSLYLKGARESYNDFKSAKTEAAKSYLLAKTNLDLQNALRVRPRDCRIYFFLGKIEYEQDMPLANTRFAECVRLYPAKPIYWYWFAKTSEKNVAKERFKHALQLHAKAVSGSKLSEDILNEITDLLKN